MNTKYTTWLLCGVLFGSVIANVVLAKANLSYYDKTYGNIAQQYSINLQVREHLERSEIEAAKKLLDEELESKGMLLAICLMENCSSKAMDIMHDKQ